MRSKISLDSVFQNMYVCMSQRCEGPHDHHRGAPPLLHRALRQHSRHRQVRVHCILHSCKLLCMYVCMYVYVTVLRGELVEQGTHQQLLQNEHGVYRNMWATQNENSWNIGPGSSPSAPPSLASSKAILDGVMHTYINKYKLFNIQNYLLLF